MATFKERIEDLAGSIPTGVDAQRFMEDGINDTIYRLEIVNPRLLDLFGKDATLTDDNGTEIDTRPLWATRDSRKCVFINPSQKDLYSDENSIYYATVNYPVAYQVGDKVYVIPAPTLDSTATIRYVSYGTISNFDASGSTISEFPSNMYHIPIIYSAMRVVNEKINNFTFSTLSSYPATPSSPTLDSVSSTLPTFTSPTDPVIPTIPSDADIDFSSLPTAPSFLKPVLSLPSVPAIADLTISSSAPTPPGDPAISSPGIDTTIVGLNATAPSFDNTAISTYIDEMNDFIDSEEDAELAAAKGQEVQIRLQNALNEFNESVTEYNAQVKIALEQAKVAMDEAGKEGAMELQADIEDYKLELSKFQASVQKYQVDVNSEVTEYTSNVKKDIDLYNSEVQASLGRYTGDIQNESARVNSELEKYKAVISKAMQSYGAETGYDISKYSAEVSSVLNEYKSLLATATTSFQQEVESYKLENVKVSARNNEKIGKYQISSTIYQAELQKVLQEYSMKIQKDSLEIKNLSSTYLRLKQEYEQAFVPYKTNDGDKRWQTK